jgi:hypothetical protein
MVSAPSPAVLLAALFLTASKPCTYETLIFATAFTFWVVCSFPIFRPVFNFPHFSLNSMPFSSLIWFCSAACYLSSSLSPQQVWYHLWLWYINFFLYIGFRIQCGLDTCRFTDCSCWTAINGRDLEASAPRQNFYSENKLQRVKEDECWPYYLWFKGDDPWVCSKPLVNHKISREKSFNLERYNLKQRNAKSSFG